ATLDSRAPTAFTYDPAYPRLTKWVRYQGGTWAQPIPTCAPGASTAPCALLDREDYTYYPAATDGANRLNQVVSTVGAAPLSAVPTIATIGYSYDALDRTIARRISTLGTQQVGSTESFQYDAIGRLTDDNNLLD